MERNIEIGFTVLDKNNYALIYHIFDTNKEMIKDLRGRHEMVDSPREFLTFGMCTHPKVYCNYEEGCVNVAVDIFLCRDHFQERVLWHETYHAMKMINHVLDCIGTSDEESRYASEEVVADLNGEITSIARKKVLPAYRTKKITSTGGTQWKN